MTEKGKTLRDSMCALILIFMYVGLHEVLQSYS